MSTVPPNLDTAGQVFQYRLVGELYDQVCITGFDYNVSAPTGTGITPTEALTSLTAKIWEGAGLVGLRNVTTTDYRSVVAEGQVISPTRYVVQLYIPAHTTGNVDGPALPPTNAVVIRKKTPAAGRKYRGRWFVPAVPAAYTVGGTLTVDGAAAYVAAYAQLATVYTVTGAGGSVVLAPVVFNLRAIANKSFINQVELDTILRVQRRREVGHGI